MRRFSRSTALVTLPNNRGYRISTVSVLASLPEVSNEPHHDFVEADDRLFVVKCSCTPGSESFQSPQEKFKPEFQVSLDLGRPIGSFLSFLVSGGNAQVGAWRQGFVEPTDRAPTGIGFSLLPFEF